MADHIEETPTLPAQPRTSRLATEWRSLVWQERWFLLAWCLIPLVRWVFFLAAGEEPIVLVVALLLICTFITMGQWLLLRNRLAHAIQWIPASLLGWVVGVGAGAVCAALLSEWMDSSIYRYEPSVLSAALIGALGGVLAGAVAGFSQWLYLRRWVSEARWWIGASSLGLCLVGTVAGIPALATRNLADGRFAVVWAVPGILFDLITGVTLLWLLKQPGDSAVGVKLPAWWPYLEAVGRWVPVVLTSLCRRLSARLACLSCAASP